MSTGKRSFKELLEANEISFLEFYETCMAVPTLDINTLYQHNMALSYYLQKMIEHLNKMSGQSYTVEDVLVEKVYG